MSDYSEVQDIKGLIGGTVLLRLPAFNKEKLQKDAATRWNITKVQDLDESSIAFIEDDVAVIVSLMPNRVPDEITSQSIEHRSMWPEAEAATAAHQAHLCVWVKVEENTDYVKQALFFNKVTEACCHQDDALGVFTPFLVRSAEDFIMHSKVIDDGLLPIFNWAFFGPTKTEKGILCFSSGLGVFGIPEIEVVEPDLDDPYLFNNIGYMAFMFLTKGIEPKEDTVINYEIEGYTISIVNSEGIVLDGKTTKLHIKKTGAAEEAAE